MSAQCEPYRGMPEVRPVKVYNNDRSRARCMGSCSLNGVLARSRRHAWQEDRPSEGGRAERGARATDDGRGHHRVDPQRLVGEMNDDGRGHHRVDPQRRVGEMNALD